MDRIFAEKEECPCGGFPCESYGVIFSGVPILKKMTPLVKFCVKEEIRGLAASISGIFLEIFQQLRIFFERNLPPINDR